MDSQNIENTVVDEFSFDSMENEKLLPVFETHSFYFGLGGGKLHSYIGLRYTQYDDLNKTYVRKHAKVGFGNAGTFSSQGELCDEKDSKAEASSETPIHKEQFYNVVNAVQNTNSNIESFRAKGFLARMFSNGKAEGTEFSGKYSLLTNNCNHFVVKMAEVAGVDTAAALHKSIFGPISARKNLENASADDSLGQTRIFYGGSLKDEEKADLITNTALVLGTAMAEDGIVVRNYKDKNGEFRKDDDAQKYLTYRDYMRAVVRNMRDIRTEDGRIKVDKIGGDEVKNKLRQIKDSIRSAIEFKMSKPHIRTNMELLKIEQLVNTELQKYEHSNQGSSEISQAVSGMTDIERATAYPSSDSNITAEIENRTVADKDLFTAANIASSTFPIGRILLVNSGATQLLTVRRTTILVSEQRQIQLLRNAIDALGRSADDIQPIIKQYMERRPFLTEDQAGKMLAISIMSAIGNFRLVAQKIMQWGTVPEENIINTSEEAGEIEQNVEKEKPVKVIGSVKNKDSQNEQFALCDDLVNLFKNYVSVAFKAIEEDRNKVYGQVG